MAYIEKPSAGIRNAREGVDTRNQGLTGAGAVKVIPESGLPAVQQGETGRVRVILVEDSDGGISVSYLPVPIEEPEPAPVEKDNRSTDEIMEELFRLVDKVDDLKKTMDGLVEIAQISDRRITSNDLFLGQRSSAVGEMVKRTRSRATRKPKLPKSGVASVIVGGHVMEVPA